MRAIPGFALAALLGLALTSCSNDEPTGPNLMQLAGSWSATRSEYASTTTSSRYDVVATGGSATLLLTADHHYAYVETRAGGLPDTTRGTWSASVDEMTWTFDAHPGWSRGYALALSNNTLHLLGGDVLYDFGAGRGLEESHHNLILTRP